MSMLATAAALIAFSFAMREAYLAGHRSKPDPHALLIDNSALRLQIFDEDRTLIVPDPDDRLKAYMRMVPHPSYVSSIKFMDVTA
jgi:hypothetical protein